MNSYRIYINEENSDRTLSGEFDAETSEEAIKQAKDFYAYELDTLPEYIIVTSSVLLLTNIATIKVQVLWDTDEEKITLPDIVEIPANLKNDEIADWLSDKYGWCVKSIVIL